jgi:hypothetical protein
MLSDLDPRAATPVAMAATWFTPTITITPGPTPVVGVDLEPELLAVRRPAADTPTIVFVVTDNGG